MIQIIMWYNFHKNFTTKLLFNKIIKHFMLNHDQISEWTGLIKYENVMKTFHWKGYLFQMFMKILNFGIQVSVLFSRLKNHGGKWRLGLWESWWPKLVGLWAQCGWFLQNFYGTRMVHRWRCQNHCTYSVHFSWYTFIFFVVVSLNVDL